MRRWRPFFWFLLASLLLHALTASVIPAPPPQPIYERITTTISSALRIEKRTQPQRAMHRPVHRPQRIARAAPAPVAQVVPQHITPRLSHSPRPVPQQSPQITQAQLDAQTRSFERTIAQAKAAQDPLAGLAQSTVRPEAPKAYAFNIRSDVGANPLPNGTITPLRRWQRGAYVYYYTHYDIEYVDGETESGDVPWPIHFPLGADPFARGGRFPLPGPPPDYVAPADTQMNPFIKNCYDHRYPYCPIEREGD
jgi:hypothetical protein